MKTLGLIGGTSWVSTIEYYRIINQQVNQRLGGLHSCKLLLYSLDLEEFKPPSEPGGWERIAEALTGISQRLADAGAECIVLCANTMHIVADIIAERVHIPLIHIAEETAKEMIKQKARKTGLLGTKITMEQPFFADRLHQSGITTFTPGEGERAFIHASIYSELGKGIFKPETKSAYLNIIENLKEQGADSIIFGCTEIPMLLQQGDCNIPVFDTTLIHATAAVNFALG